MDGQSRSTFAATGRKTMNSQAIRPEATTATVSLTQASSSEIIELNVGGRRFTSSKQTLMSIPDTFFTSMVSNRIESLKDANGSVFIDRDPYLFSIILNYMRSRQIVDYKKVGAKAIRDEAEYYGILPLVRRLDATLDCVVNQTCGGDVIFQGQIKSTRPRASVVAIEASHNAICVAHVNYVNCYRLKDSLGWQTIYDSEMLQDSISSVAFCYNNNNCTGSGVAFGGKLMIGLGHFDKQYIRLWTVTLSTNISTGENVTVSNKVEIGCFNLNKSCINSLFFVGSQLVALGYDFGRVGIWQAASQHWLVQDLKQNVHEPITAHDRAGCNFLLLGSQSGSIYLIDMQKFPLRMKDGDLLINQLYRDPDEEEITSISCYLTRTPKTSGNWIEIAYGTRGGTVRVLVQHPETVGHGPQLFQTFKVHLVGISRVMLSEKYLISMCDKMHCRSWTLTRFRGRISTQPGPQPYASFGILKMTVSDELNVDEDDFCELNNQLCLMSRLNAGPWGDQDDGDKQVFIETLKSSMNAMNVMLASNGNTVCCIRSVDKSRITTYCVHEVEGVSMGNRSRRFIITGHNTGHIQVWDLSTAFELVCRRTPKSTTGDYNLQPEELFRQLNL